MEPARKGVWSPRSGMASVRVRELSWPGLHNPCPQSTGLSERLTEGCLSPVRLQALAQVDDLRTVRTLEMCVDTHRNSLGNFGVHLPNLSQLKLNGSRLASVRDLGTSLGHLQVLWLARCGLPDLDGIGSFPALKELYVSFNNVSDLSPLCLLQQLEVLDLEGNSVEDLGQVRYLQLCPQLATLTLQGNLVCLRPDPGPSNKAPRDYNYRAEVCRLIPQLQVLDEAPVAQTGLPATRTLTEDWLMVKEAIREGGMLDGLLPGLGMGSTHPLQEGAHLARRPPHGPQERSLCQSHPPLPLITLLPPVASAHLPRPHGDHVVPHPLPHPQSPIPAHQTLSSSVSHCHGSLVLPGSPIARPREEGLRLKGLALTGPEPQTVWVGLGTRWLAWATVTREPPILTSTDRPHGAPRQRQSPKLSVPKAQPRTPSPWPLSLLIPGGPLLESLHPEDPAPEDNVSNLTHGVSHVLCGNPTKGLRERRHHCQTWVPPEQLSLPHHQLRDLAAHASASRLDPADSPDLLSKLLIWRELSQCPLPCRHREPSEEGTGALQGPRRYSTEQQEEARSQAAEDPPGTAPECSAGPARELMPSPPKSRAPPGPGSGSWGSTKKPFRGRRLRGLGPELAGGTALRGQDVASGQSLRAHGCPTPQPILDPPPRRQVSFQCFQALGPIIPAHPHP
ncbi:leucine-rich repeat-containing protein 56 isoform X1 [Tenrec ecaudatus]|uniref:leucine-rich repeat-containing protein 56 isoform X1 n=1 Tax=Tenrec ecaudatus TaxID=94439 RepID=UPI003F5ACB31